MLWSQSRINQRLECLEDILGLLITIDKKVNYIMSQLDDLKTAVALELSDAQALLLKLSQLTAPSDDPQVADLISQLQASHAAIQAVLNPPVVTTP